MKKLISMILIMAVVLSLASCSLFFDMNVIYVHGLNEYIYDASWNGLTQNLFPSTDFIQKYNYVDGDYHYYDNCNTNEDFLEKVLCVLEYEDNIYQKAKAFCVSEMDLNTESKIEYK